jgi:hypothetical protein
MDPHAADESGPHRRFARQSTGYSECADFSAAGAVKKHGEVPNFKSFAAAMHDGRNALFFLSASEERTIEIAELLMARGADAALTDKDGMTAAEFAMQQGLENVAEILRGP